MIRGEKTAAQTVDATPLFLPKGMRGFSLTFSATGDLRESTQV